MVALVFEAQYDGERSRAEAWWWGLSVGVLRGGLLLRDLVAEIVCEREAFHYVWVSASVYDDDPSDVVVSVSVYDGDPSGEAVGHLLSWISTAPSACNKISTLQTSP